MSGIMAALAGSSKRVNYGSGLYLVGSGPVVSPVTATAGYPTSSQVYSYIGYYRAATTGTYSFGTSTVYNPGLLGTGYSQGRVWIGDTAISGYNDSNLLSYSSSSYSTGNYAVVQGLYYPIRVQWNYYDQYGAYLSYSGDGSIAFYVNGTSSIGSTIFYNTATNGF